MKQERQGIAIIGQSPPEYEYDGETNAEITPRMTHSLSFLPNILILYTFLGPTSEQSFLPFILLSLFLSFLI